MTTNQIKPLLVGVTGSIATGKSIVAEFFAELGAHLIDFDMLSREVVCPDMPAWKDIIAHFGEEMMSDDRSLDRKKISEVVFADKGKREKLEEFTHPRIQDRFLAELTRITSIDQTGVILAIVPLLIEVKMMDKFEKIIVVATDYETQLNRLMERDFISRFEAARIISSQIPVEEKTKYADFVINNNNSVEETKRQVDRVWQKLLSLRSIA